MQQSGQRHQLDAPALLFEVGRQVQALALLAKRHRMAPAQQICQCGRLALRLLPMLGLRCEIVCAQWDLAYRLLKRVLERMADRSLGGEVESRAVGRAAVQVLNPAKASRWW